MATLEELRKEIDVIDRMILDALAKRKEAVLGIAKIKEQQGMPVLDAAREDALKERLRQKAVQNNLDAEFVLKLYDIILANSKKEQQAMINRTIIH